MLTLYDGRSELWQWDTGRTLAVDADCSQVHFSNKVFGRSIDVDVDDGVATIPDILLQTDKDLNVWAFVGTAENGYTKISKTFKVNRRNKPADYVFTPVEQTTIAEIAAIAQSVRDDADNGLFDGAQGPVGPIGPVGPQGKQGLEGEKGEKGEKGDIGPQGPKGDKGDTGPQGETGATGPQGPKGDKGDDGPQGPQGDTGPKGDTGPAGPAGANGKDGAPGADGKTPEYGVDYGTPEQISGIAQKAAEILQPKLNQIKDELAKKVPKSDYAPEAKTDAMTQPVGKDSDGKLWTAPGSGGSGIAVSGATVGQTVKIAAVDDGGVPTAWEPVDLPSGGGVSDIQIDGASIVGEDGKAVIPVAEYNKYGLIKYSIASHYGYISIGKYGSPKISFEGQENNEVFFVKRVRNPIYTIPFLAKGFDLMVKHAMCDTGTATSGYAAPLIWSDAERISALLRLGCTVDDNGFVKWAAQEGAE